MTSLGLFRKVKVPILLHFLTRMDAQNLEIISKHFYHDPIQPISSHPTPSPLIFIFFRDRGWVNNHRRFIDSFFKLATNSRLSLN